jgi:hypothetical protein
MNSLALLAAFAAACAALAACDGTVTTSSKAEGTAAADGNEVRESTIRADMNGIRANIDLPGTDVRVDGNSVSVDVNSGDLKASVRTNPDGSVSITTNAQ